MRLDKMLREISDSMQFGARAFPPGKLLALGSARCLSCQDLFEPSDRNREDPIFCPECARAPHPDDELGGGD